MGNQLTHTPQTSLHTAPYFSRDTIHWLENLVGTPSPQGGVGEYVRFLKAMTEATRLVDMSLATVDANRQEPCLCICFKERVSSRMIFVESAPLPNVVNELLAKSRESEADKTGLPGASMTSQTTSIPDSNVVYLSTAIKEYGEKGGQDILQVVEQSGKGGSLQILQTIGQELSDFMVDFNVERITLRGLDSFEVKVVVTQISTGKATTHGGLSRKETLARIAAADGWLVYITSKSPDQ